MRKNVDTPTYQLDFELERVVERMGTDGYYSVIDIRNVYWASPEVKAWIKTETAARLVKGYAIVADSAMSAALADVWVRLTDLPFPVKRFRKWEDGLAWIREIESKGTKSA